MKNWLESQQGCGYINVKQGGYYLSMPQSQRHFKQTVIEFWSWISNSHPYLTLVTTYQQWFQLLTCWIAHKDPKIWNHILGHNDLILVWHKLMKFIMGNTRCYPHHIVNIMAAGVLATSGARTSAGMLLTYHPLFFRV